MRSSITIPSLSILALALAGCGGSDSGGDTAMVSFSVADAPVDDVKAVWVTLESITLTDTNDDTTSQTLVINGEDGLRINLKDYQDGAKKLILSEEEVALGDYNLTLNTLNCPQSANGTGSTSYCSIIKNDDTEYPLKTPSNKLKLGSFTVNQEGTQAYTIDFNLRSALVNNGGGDNYNLKPHGISIVDNSTLGSIETTVTDALFYRDDTTCTSGTGNALYLYKMEEGDPSFNPSDDILGDEFDRSTDTDVADNIWQPYASKLVTSDGEVTTTFANLPTGDYTLAFSCSDAGVDQNDNAVNGDDPEIYNQIPVAISDGVESAALWTVLTVNYNEVTTHTFDEPAP